MQLDEIRKNLERIKYDYEDNALREKWFRIDSSDFLILIESVESLMSINQDIWNICGR